MGCEEAEADTGSEEKSFIRSRKQWQYLERIDACVNTVRISSSMKARHEVVYIPVEARFSIPKRR